MKHGIVTDGRTTTLYGDHATNWMVRQAALHCFTREKALEMIRSTSGSYRQALVANLEGKFLEDKSGRRRKFVVTKKLRKEIEESDKLAEERMKAWGRYHTAQQLKSKEPKEAKRTLTINCMMCDQPVKAGQRYHGVRIDYRNYRAHTKCVNKVKKPKN